MSRPRQMLVEIAFRCLDQNSSNAVTADPDGGGLGSARSILQAWLVVFEESTQQQQKTASA